MTSKLRKPAKTEISQTLIGIIFIALIVWGFWFGAQAALNTKIPPALAVTSGSMCIPSGMECNGLSYPFDRTLHIGDLVIIQGVDPKTLSTNYPDSDIIVFHAPNNPGGELVTRRIVKTQEINGTIYFFTKGDGSNSPNVWPKPVADGKYDGWLNSDPAVPAGAVSQDLIEGKVVIRIPWIGHIVMFVEGIFGPDIFSFGVPIIVFLIIVFLIVEFVFPMLKRKIRTPTKLKG